MYATWLGQAGMLFETESGLRIMVDPYLSDSLAERGPAMRRLTPIDERFLNMDIDVLVLTHNHGDHVDMATLKQVLSQEKCVDVLASYTAWEAVRSTLDPKHNYTMFNAGTEWTRDGVTLRAVPAIHNDFHAIGLTFKADGLSVYVTGDTLYDRRVIDAVAGEKIDCFFPVINGKGNNMNPADAVRMTKQLVPRWAYPLHWDTFVNFAADPAEFTSPLTGSETEAAVMEQYVSFKLGK